MDIPNEAAATFPPQAGLYNTDIGLLSQASYGNGVVKGAQNECAVTAQGSPDMTLAVATGVVAIGSTLVAVAAGNVTITTADATNPRFDLVVVDNAGAKSVVAGTAAASPVLPAIPSNSTVLARVYVPASDTAINSNQITDARMFINAYGVLTRILATVTVVNTTTETDLLNKTIIGGLMGTDRKLRITLHGDYLNNSGSTALLTLKVYFGGTVYWNDVTSTIATLTTRRPFTMQIEIGNLNSASAQWIGGFVLIGAGGGATTGIGDLGAAGFRETVFSSNGAAAINTGNDAVVKVTATHGTANAALDIRLQRADIELV